MLFLFQQIPDEKCEDVYLELPSTAQWICNENDEVERLIIIIDVLLIQQSMVVVGNFDSKQ